MNTPSGHKMRAEELQGMIDNLVNENMSSQEELFQAQTQFSAVDKEKTQEIKDLQNSLAMVNSQNYPVAHIYDYLLDLEDCIKKEIEICRRKLAKLQTKNCLHLEKIQTLKEKLDEEPEQLENYINVTRLQGELLRAQKENSRQKEEISRLLEELAERDASLEGSGAQVLEDDIDD